MIITNFMTITITNSIIITYSSPFHDHQNELNLDVSSGILIPLYDPDTNMVILAGKGDRYMQFVEVDQRCLHHIGQGQS